MEVIEGMGEGKFNSPQDIKGLEKAATDDVRRESVSHAGKGNRRGRLWADIPKGRQTMLVGKTSFRKVRGGVRVCFHWGRGK